MLNISLFYYRGSNLRGHSRFHHGNAEQYWDGGILSTTPQCFFYHDYPNRLVIESSVGHDYEVRDAKGRGDGRMAGIVRGTLGVS